MQSEFLFNPFDPEFRADPYPVYRKLLDEAPVRRNPMGMVVLCRYADCNAMLRDPRSSSDETNSSLWAQLEEDPAASTEPSARRGWSIIPERIEPLGR